jgi:hypothetical protein
MKHRELEGKPAVALVGGLTDSEETLRVLAEPLATTHRLFYLDSRWSDRVETAGARIERVRTQLAEIAEGQGELAIIGISAGGPLAISAAKDLDTVSSIVTASSPLRWPEKLSFKLKAVLNRYPTLDNLLGQFTEGVLPNINSMGARLMNFRGTRDMRVPPELSTVDGAINQQFPTPKGIIFASHSYNVRAAIGSKTLGDFIARPRIT